MGPFRGAQAEMLRVPFAELNCTKLPGSPGDKWEDDFVLLADIFPTGYYSTKLAMVQPGSSVAVFGAEPVGLLAAYSALLQGAAQAFCSRLHPGEIGPGQEYRCYTYRFYEKRSGSPDYGDT